MIAHIMWCLSELHHSSTLSWTSSQADILPLIVQQRYVGGEVAAQSTGGGSAGGGLAGGGSTKHPGLLFNDDKYSDSEEHQSPIKKQQKSCHT